MTEPNEETIPRPTKAAWAAALPTVVSGTLRGRSFAFACVLCPHYSNCLIDNQVSIV
jgi:hypothetical protein